MSLSPRPLWLPPRGISRPAMFRDPPNTRGCPPGRGIYRITCHPLMQVYVGQTVDFGRRFFTHQEQLLRNAHQNKRLQRAFNSYGHECFTFEVLEYVHSRDSDLMSLAEHRWMLAHRGHMFNVRPAGSDSFIRRFKHILNL